ncbi:MAG: drug/metabolite exporter YedA [Kofleriaceae bacterium]
MASAGFADPAVVTSASSPSAAQPGRRTIDPKLIASLAAVYVIWSSTYVAIRIAVESLPPLLMASARFSTAGLVLLIVAIRRGSAWPSLREWRRVFPIGLLLFLGGNGFVAISEMTVSSSGAAVVCALMPLWVGVLGIMTREMPSRREWFSLVVGFVGVVVLIGSPSLAGKPLHVALLLAAPICWAAGSMYARRLPPSGPSDAFLAPAMQMITGSMVLLVAGIATGEQIPDHVTTASWLAFGYLWLFGSMIAFTAYNWLLRHARPAVATSYAYVNPILAVIMGAAISGEPLGASMIIANVLIVGAVMLALMRRR